MDDKLRQITTEEELNLFHDDQILGSGDVETRLCAEMYHSLNRSWTCSALKGHPGDHRWTAGIKPQHWDFVDEDGCLYCNCEIGLHVP